MAEVIVRSDGPRMPDWVYYALVRMGQLPRTEQRKHMEN